MKRGFRFGALAGALAALALTGCNLRYALFGLPEPVIRVIGTAPAEMAYREAGGHVIVTARVNNTADVDFVLDTGAPVTILIDGPQTAILRLDTSKAEPLGNAGDPATPVGVIREGFTLKLGAISVDGLALVLVPVSTMACREKFDELAFGGVIGGDLFRRFVVEIDPAAHHVRFHEPRDWVPPAGASTIPLSLAGDGNVYVDARVTLTGGKTIETRLQLDTGMDKALMLPAGESAAIPAPGKGEATTACMVGGIRDELIGPPAELRAGDFALRVDAPSYTAPKDIAAVQRGGALGNAAFQGKRIFIDYSSKRLVLMAL